MEENDNPQPDHQIQRKIVGGGGGGQTIQRAKNNKRFPVEDDGAGHTIECSGKSCRSYAGVLIADCVALCCCPCAVVNILTLAFFKVPWMMGKKCLGLRKRKRKNKLKRKSCKEIDHDSGCGEMNRDGDGIWRKEEGMSGIVTFEDARHEAAKEWLELYQVDHLGFGRVSFTGKGNSGN